MKTIPKKCKDVKVVGAFCDCIADVDTVDVAAQNFCEHSKTDSGKKNTTGEDLAELKKALMDLEKPGD